MGGVNNAQDNFTEGERKFMWKNILAITVWIKNKKKERMCFNLWGWEWGIVVCDRKIEDEYKNKEFNTVKSKEGI